MKTPRFIPAGLLLASSLLVSSIPLTLVAAPKVEVLIDFTDVRTERTGEVTKNYQYAFQSWEKHISDMPRRGALVQAKDNKGGLGENRPDIPFDKDPLVALIFVIGNANNAKAINFSLTDSDETEQQWTISLEGLPKGKPQVVPFDLTKCTTEVKPGKKPGMNLKKIDSWQIKGDYSDANVEILLVKLITARKE